MAKDWARPFYNSKLWIKCRKGYMQSKNYICERCGSMAIICHHKTWLDPTNIDNPEISLNWDNLEALCQTCHNQEHLSGDTISNELYFDVNGHLVKK